MLDDRVVRAHAVAVVALEAVAAGHAAACLRERGPLVQASDDLVERPDAALRVEPAPLRALRLRVVPGVEHVEGGQFGTRRPLVPLTPQPGVDVAGRALTGPDGRGDGPLGGHQVAAGEDAGVPGHHVRTDLDHAVLDLDAAHAVHQGTVDVLADRQHDGVRVQLLELAGRPGEAGLVQFHPFNGD